MPIARYRIEPFGWLEYVRRFAIYAVHRKNAFNNPFCFSDKAGIEKAQLNGRDGWINSGAFRKSDGIQDLRLFEYISAPNRLPKSADKRSAVTMCCKKMSGRR